MSSWVCIAVLCYAILFAQTLACGCGCDDADIDQNVPDLDISSSSESNETGEDTTETSTTDSQSCENDTTEKPSLQCGRNEVEACVKPCPPERTCQHRVINIACIYDPNPCKKKCVCAPGYFRNYLGECITAAQCDQCNKTHEFYSCGSACDNECSKMGKQNRTHCPIINIKCNEKCYCEDGYARDGDGNCIPVDQCKKCGPNEVQKCVKPCPPEKTCTNRDPGALVRCRGDLNCTTQCVCADGYFRNYLGECITEAQCDQCNKTNEFYSCGSACDNECSTIGKQNRTHCPIINIKCNEKCYCEDGYARDGDGNCIPVDQCKKCGPNEVQKCVKSCPPQKTCKNRNALYKCRGDLNCTNQCVCADGYFRNYLGECITEAQCDQCNKTNEFYSCGSACDNECSTIGKQNRTNCPIINVKCNEKCYCEDGYARDGDGNCIPVDQCKKCGRNEVQKCVKSCPPQRTCKTRNALYKCSGDLNCTTQCVCADGYYRNYLGECITEAQCDQCNKTNEFYSCGGACDNECSTIGKQNRTNCPIINVKCNEKCYCEDGYARDGDGNCIPVDQCKKCGPDEVQRCVMPCPPQRTCRNRNIQYRCRGDLNCTQQCVCKDGLYRNAIGECITLDRCKQCDKPNEFYSCNSACDNECDKIKTQNRTNCPIKNKKCTEQCYCDDGYARDKDGNCIPVDDCKPSPLICGSHEVEQCVYSCPPEKTCKNRNIEYDCAAPPEDFPCTRKCVCEPGYVRNDNGQCIPVEKCEEPSLQCGENEVEACVKSCPPERTCRNRFIMILCINDPKPCKKKCICAQGYYRNYLGKCITEAQCDKCNKPHEFYDCGSACDNECAKIETQNRTNCPIVNVKCNEKCYCEDGYARDGDGNCIPVNQCKTCRPDEVQKCVKPCPPERTCRNRDIQYKCRGDLNCTQQCVCKDGLYRNAIGECITLDECTQCFASWACDNECDKIKTQNRTNCPIKNIKCNEQCYCDDGYARDKDGNCIPVSECKPPPSNCGPHEVEQCVWSCPPEKTCKNRNIMYKCARDGKPCKMKCVCEQGYVRNAIGQCIPVKKCDECKKPHEFFACDSACDNECAKIETQNRTNCPIKNKKCNEQCYCDDGYARDENGNCIPVDECNKHSCGQNEEYVLKKRSCPPETCVSMVSDYDCSKAPPPKPGCACKSGYLRRNATSPCIPSCQCPEISSTPDCQKKNCKDPNEEFVQEKQSCPPDTCEALVARYNCTGSPPPSPGCTCKSGYRRLNGKCVPLCKCPQMANSPECTTPTCGENEEYVQKKQSCPPDTCESMVKKYNCTGAPPPSPGCTCKSGYRRLNGKCVPRCKCPQIANTPECKTPPCGENEEYVQKKQSCPPDTCEALVSKYNCTGAPPPCPGCTCKSGYRRLNGKCVPRCKCPQIANTPECKPPPCGENEEYVQKKQSCPPDSCEALVAKYNCTGAPPPCPGCTCKSGYRRLNGKCVPRCKCPQIANTPECKTPPCGENEEYVQKKQSCPPDTCEALVAKYNCTGAPPPCPGCTCKSGYRRLNGKCVPLCKCPQMANSPECTTPTCGENEEYVQKKQSCPPDTCEALVAKYNCTGAPPPCPGCTCKSGYRRLNGKCVPRCKCPQIANTPECKTPPCGENEEYVQKKQSCPPDTCEAIVAKYNCTGAPPPSPGCTCKSGYRRLNGKCVPRCKCPQIANTPECKPTCGENEEYVQEKQTCPPEICISLVARYDCSNEPPRQPGCACKSGYLRLNLTSPCMPICKCPEIANTPECKTPPCGENEEYVQKKQSCPPDTCEAIVAKYNCTGAPPPSPGCTCKPGYRRLNGKCVPRCKCPQIANTPECKTPPCGENEEYVQEKQSCPPDTCEAIVARYNCTGAPPPSPGCTCKSGYRRLNGKCVRLCDCPQMANSPECKTPTCGENEVYVQEKRTCPPQTCESILALYNCKDAPPPKPGCACKPGYLRRNETSPCIPSCQCPENTPSSKSCKDPNEVFVQEKQTCPPDTCEAIVARYNCTGAPPPCPGCTCKSGYRRLNGICVPRCKCPQIANTPECKTPPCGENEEYVQKKQSCPPDTCEALVAKYNCTGAPPPSPGCTCKSGYRRLNGKCVPRCKCPQIANTPECTPACGENEEYVQKKQSCPPDTCEALVARYNCTGSPPPSPGCTCKSGYRRLNGKCVPLCKCPQMANSPECTPACGENEEYVQEKQTCPPEICISLVARYDCSNEPPRQPGCACKSGYLRLNLTSPCMPICKCPEMVNSPDCGQQTCGENEEYVQSKQTCPGDTCNALVEKRRCPETDTVPPPGCVCKTGYRRLKTGECVPLCKCPEMAYAPQCQSPEEPDDSCGCGDN